MTPKKLAIIIGVALLIWAVILVGVPIAGFIFGPGFDP